MPTRITFQYKTNRIGLKPFSEEDLLNSNYRNWFHDNLVTKGNSHGKFHLTKEGIQSFLQSINDGTKVVFAIYALKEAEDLIPEKAVSENEKNICYHIGNISLQKIDLFNRSAEYAILIGESDYWGKQVAEEATRIILFHGFHKLGLHRIYAGIPATNIAMQKVFEKLKFSKEGLEREAMYLNGEFVDIYKYAFLLENALDIIEEEKYKYE